MPIYMRAMKPISAAWALWFLQRPAFEAPAQIAALPIGGGELHRLGSATLFVLTNWCRSRAVDDGSPPTPNLRSLLWPDLCITSRSEGILLGGPYSHATPPTSFDTEAEADPGGFADLYAFAPGPRSATPQQRGPKP